jgi:hypothetical protein
VQVVVEDVVAGVEKLRGAGEMSICLLDAWDALCAKMVRR